MVSRTSAATPATLSTTASAAAGRGYRSIRRPLMEGAAPILNAKPARINASIGNHAVDAVSAPRLSN